VQSPKNVRHSAPAPPFAPRPATPHPQHRKINCTLQNALVEKAAWCVAMRPLLKLRLRCKASHAEERAAFRSTPPTLLPHHRKINCTLQNALAEKAARWAAMC